MFHELGQGAGPAGPTALARGGRRFYRTGFVGTRKRYTELSLPFSVLKWRVRLCCIVEKSLCYYLELWAEVGCSQVSRLCCLQLQSEPVL